MYLGLGWSFNKASRLSGESAKCHVPENFAMDSEKTVRFHEREPATKNKSASGISEFTDRGRVNRKDAFQTSRRPAVSLLLENPKLGLPQVHELKFFEPTQGDCSVVDRGIVGRFRFRLFCEKSIKDAAYKVIQ